MLAILILEIVRDLDGWLPNNILKILIIGNLIVQALVFFLNLYIFDKGKGLTKTIIFIYQLIIIGFYLSALFIYGFAESLSNWGPG